MISLDNQDCAYNPAEGRHMVMRTLMDPDALERCTGPREPRRPVPSLPASDVPCVAVGATEADRREWRTHYTRRHIAKGRRAAVKALLWAVAVIGAGWAVVVVAQ